MIALSRTHVAAILTGNKCPDFFTGSETAEPAKRMAVPHSTHPPLVSIIIPAYKAGRFLPATLKSIREQTFTDWECIVVDDGSPDQTAAMAKQFASEDVRFRVVMQENAGVSAARNRGFAESNPGAQYVTFMDADDVWLPDALKILHNTLEKHPGMIGAHALADFIDAGGQPYREGEFVEFGRKRMECGENRRVKYCDFEQPTSFRTLLLNNAVYPPGVLLSKRIYYEKVGPFDSATTPVEDWDMLIRLGRHGDIHFINKVIVLYRRHDANMSAQDEAVTRRAIRRLQHKTFFSPENSQEQRKIVEKSWKAMQVICVEDKLRSIPKKVASGHYATAGKILAGLYAHFHRYLRGYPTLRGL